MPGAFDVIVVGGGHSGCEAAAASARIGASTALVTLSFATVGTMSCNPAIGGLGKGHLVREIDALDGLMGRIADKAGIQFRVLNRTKGPAVRGPRAQTDRKLYRDVMQAAIRDIANLSVIEAEAADILLENGRIEGIETADGEKIRCGALVLTTGTFLRGVIHIGDKDLSGRAHRGKPGDPPRRETARSRPWPWASQDRNAAKARRRHDRVGTCSNARAAMPSQSPFPF